MCVLHVYTIFNSIWCNESFYMFCVLMHYCSLTLLARVLVYLSTYLAPLVYISIENITFTVKRRRLTGERHNNDPTLDFVAPEVLHVETNAKQVCCAIHECNSNPNGI